MIEHVMPQRAYAREIMKVIEAVNSEDDLIAFIKKNYRLVLLTKSVISKNDPQL